MKYRAVFNYNGKKPNFLKKGAIESAFVDAYNQWCDITNDRLEKWNREYDDSGMPHDHVDENGCINPDGEYTRYIRWKEEEIARAIKMTPLWTKLFKRFLVGKECQFQGELKDGTIMDVSIVPYD